MIGFLGVPDESPAARELFEGDLAELGFVMNASRLWAYQPELMTGLYDLIRATALPYRHRAVLVAACASAFGDSYCSLAWGTRLAKEIDEPTAAGVLAGDDSGLSPAERALAGWARAIARNPQTTGEADVEVLRAAGFADQAIFAMTVFVALRVALSTVNAALGVRPDAELAVKAPAAVRSAVVFGRPPFS